MRGILHLIGIALAGMAVASPLAAREFAVLNNGFRLHADRHEVDGGTLRLYSESGFTELPGSSVARFEREEEISAPAPAAAVRAPAPLAVVRTPASPSALKTPEELAAAAAEKFALPASFVKSVMKAESAFHATSISPKGAVGLMQLMPETARILGVDPRNPKQNADGGAQYLRDLLAKYEENPDQVVLALAAYNAGPAAVDRYHGVPPYRETREYILRVLRNWDRQEIHK